MAAASAAHSSGVPPQSNSPFIATLWCCRPGADAEGLVRSMLASAGAKALRRQARDWPRAAARAVSRQASRPQRTEGCTPLGWMPRVCCSHPEIRPYTRPTHSYQKPSSFSRQHPQLKLCKRSHAFWLQSMQGSAAREQSEDSSNTSSLDGDGVINLYLHQSKAVGNCYPRQQRHQQAQLLLSLQQSFPVKTCVHGPFICQVLAQNQHAQPTRANAQRRMLKT